MRGISNLFPDTYVLVGLHREARETNLGYIDAYILELEKEGEREKKRERGGEGGREKEEEREGGREKEGEREGGRERGREKERKRERER